MLSGAAALASAWGSVRTGSSGRFLNLSIEDAQLLADIIDRLLPE